MDGGHPWRVYLNDVLVGEFDFLWQVEAFVSSFPSKREELRVEPRLWLLNHSD